MSDILIFTFWRHIFEIPVEYELEEVEIGDKKDKWRMRKLSSKRDDETLSLDFVRSQEMRPSLRVGEIELNRTDFLATGRALMILRICDGHRWTENEKSYLPTGGGHQFQEITPGLQAWEISHRLWNGRLLAHSKSSLQPAQFLLSIVERTKTLESDEDFNLVLPSTTTGFLCDLWFAI